MANSNMKDLRIGHAPQKINLKSWQEVHVYSNNNWQQVYNENTKYGDPTYTHKSFLAMDILNDMDGHLLNVTNSIIFHKGTCKEGWNQK